MQSRQRKNQETTRNKPSQKQIQPSDVGVQNEVKLDVVNPIPFEINGTASAFYFDGSKKYIPFLNPKDDFFNTLLEASLLSPTNNSCINSKIFFCSGRSFRIKESDDKTDKKISEEFKKFQKRVNNKRQSLGKIIDSFFSKHFRTGNNFIEIVKAQAGGTKKVFVYNRNFLECRLGEPDENDIPQTVIISKKFLKTDTWTIDDKNSVELPLFNYEDTKWKEMPDGTLRCVMHIKNEMDGYEYYGLPENVSSLPWQILEYKGARYNLDNFDNNMVIGGAIILQGNFSDSELTTVAKQINRQHVGDGKRGRWTVMSNKQGTGTIQNFQKQTDGDFLKLDENAEQKIINTNNWDKALYGGSENRGLGNGGNAYLKNIFKIKHKTVVEPTREIIIEEFLLPYLQIVDEWTGSKWSEYEYEFESINIEDLIEQLDINSIIKVDEGRVMMGHDKVGGEKGELFISEVAAKNKKDVQTKQNA
ncbi:hypothetical protein BAS10_07210 [Elizabethkingia meningoseptica]|uniref:hypothetical protein n=1 Tax=Elizabethkingia meningoseptica TaxID=238 RepID=UPI000999097E|nr:hypothetical protein [Elizabethkingia meningoseptica]OPB96830.1 hypothetical protein BAS10_07210 [Elizabethkingia meningoseptica]